MDTHSPDPGHQAPLYREVAHRRPSPRDWMPAAAAFALGIGGALAMLPVWLLPSPVPHTTVIEPVAAIVPMPVAIPYGPDREEATERVPLIELAPVVHDQGLRLILDEGIDEAWLSDGIHAEAEEGPTVVTRPLSEAGQAVFAGYRQRLVALSDGTRIVCHARIVNLEAFGRYYPDWAIEEQPPEHGLSHWEAVASHWSVAGKLVADSGDCQGALWAQDASAEAATYGAIAQAPAELADKAAQYIRDSGDFYNLRLSNDDDIEIDSQLVTTGDDRLLVTTVRTYGCADLEPTLTALYRIDGQDELQFMGSPTRVNQLLAAADTDGDGHTELLFSDDTVGVAVMSRVGRRYSVRSSAPVVVYGCRC